MIVDYVSAQHEHISPHRSMTLDYVPTQHKRNSTHRSTINDYVPARHEHNREKYWLLSQIEILDNSPC